LLFLPLPLSIRPKRGRATGEVAKFLGEVGRGRGYHLTERDWERERFKFFKERLGEEEVRVFQREVGRGRGRGYHLRKRG